MLCMLFNLLLANITILLCFFVLFRVVFGNFFKTPVDIENARLKLAFVFPADPITLANDAIEILPLVADKTNYQRLIKKAIYLLSLLLNDSLSLISAMK